MTGDINEVIKNIKIWLPESVKKLPITLVTDVLKDPDIKSAMISAGKNGLSDYFEFLTYIYNLFEDGLVLDLEEIKMFFGIKVPTPCFLEKVRDGLDVPKGTILCAGRFGGIGVKSFEDSTVHDIFRRYGFVCASFYCNGDYVKVR